MGELTVNQKSMVGFMARSEQHESRGFELILKTAAPEDFFDELQAHNFFSGANNPRPQPVEGQDGYFRIPYWPALSYLIRVAEIAGERGDVDLGTKVMAAARSIETYRDADGEVDNYHTRAALAEILAAVPVACVAIEDVRNVEAHLRTTWGNSLSIPKLSKALGRFLRSPDEGGHAKAVALLQASTQLRKASESERSTHDIVSVADSYWLEQLLEKNAEALGLSGKRAALDVLSDRLRLLFSDDYVSKNSWLWRAAIEEHEQNHDWDHLVNAFVDTFRDALSAWVGAEPEAAKPYVGDMLADESQIVRRLAIHACRTHWDVLEDTFMGAVSLKHFEDFGHLHEMYMLLNDQFEHCDAQCRATILRLILSLSEGGELVPDERDRRKHLQRNWLHAIKGKGVREIDDAYELLTAELGPIRPYPDLISYHSSGWVGDGPSPYTKEELLLFARNRTLVKRVDSYETTQGEGRSPRKALIDEVSGVVREHPMDFSWLLSENANPSRQLQYGILNGVAKILESESSAQQRESLSSILEALAAYMHGIVSDEAFWDEQVVETGDFEPTKDWIPPVITTIAKNLASNDEIGIPPDVYEALVSTCLFIMRHAEGITPSGDPMTATINNPRGRAVEALLQLLLRSCRDADKISGNHDESWLTAVQLLDQELDGCVQGQRLESSTLFGSFLSQLIYMNGSWVRANIASIFPAEHVQNFVSAISGLAFANYNVSTYVALQSAEIPRLALGMDEISGSRRERLLERIALAYMWGTEALDSVLMLEMFEPHRLEDLTELVSTVARWADESLGQEHIDRARSLASTVVNALATEPERGKQLLSAASKFIGYLPVITDEDMTWLAPSAKWAHLGYSGDSFLEQLDKHATSESEKVMELLKAFLESYELSNDFRGRLHSIIRKLNSAGLHLKSIAIVSAVIEKGAGSQWLDLYKEISGTAP